MAKKIHNIHDKFVKASFSDPDRAAAFFENFLPEILLKEIDLTSLKPVQESYIQGDLSEYFSDMIFEVSSNSGDAIDIVLLFEHKSSPDKYVLIQLGHYIFAHWLKCVNEGKKLKVIVPFIYYQGKQKWEQPNLTTLFPKVNGTIASYIPILNHLFIALNSLPDENISQIRNKMMAAAVMAQKKGINLMKLADDFIKILELFPETAQGGNFLEQIFVYVISVSDISKPELNKAIESIPSNIKENIMTTYTRIKEEGKIEGKIESKIEVILNGFDEGLNISLLANITHLSEDEVINILRTHKKMD
ncbi:MAG: Rpn family recombination-promoting nuclease/putative transposase [Saprospiraceae bacterium]|nr:Rpn family recombination-promoting nuclease/putative transposase [Saprospiraceae bacterium]